MRRVVCCSMVFRLSVFWLVLAVPVMTTTRLPILLGFMANPGRAIVYTLVHG